MMFNFFKKERPIEKLEKEYKKLLNEGHQLSTSNRTLSDQKIVAAEAIANKIEALKNKS